MQPSSFEGALVHLFWPNGQKPIRARRQESLHTHRIDISMRTSVYPKVLYFYDGFDLGVIRSDHGTPRHPCKSRSIKGEGNTGESSKQALLWADKLLK